MAGITALELLVRLGYEMERLSTGRCAELLGESVQAFRERDWIQSRIRDALAAEGPLLTQTGTAPDNANQMKGQE